MRVAVFSTHKFEAPALREANRSREFAVDYLDSSLSEETARLVHGYDVVCAFANDRLNAGVIRDLEAGGVKLIALRSAGFNNVDLKAAARAGIRVVRVPAYSPYAVAEYATAMILALNRHIHRAYNRVREGNFSLDGLVGFDLHGKTVGIVGTGRIGSVFAGIMHGFGCRLLAFDKNPDPALEARLGVRYTDLETLCRESDVVSLHIPLRPDTHHLIDEKLFSLFKTNALLVNTGRGALIDTRELVRKLKEESLGGACLDVYEEEESLYFQDHSGEVLKDDLLARLLTFPNVLVTAHQGFLTREAIRNIAETTFQSIEDFKNNRPLANEVKAQ